jgi:hypothetical protein
MGLSHLSFLTSEVGIAKVHASESWGHWLVTVVMTTIHQSLQYRPYPLQMPVLIHE